MLFGQSTQDDDVLYMRRSWSFNLLVTHTEKRSTAAPWALWFYLFHHTNDNYLYYYYYWPILEKHSTTYVYVWYYGFVARFTYIRSTTLSTWTDTDNIHRSLLGSTRIPHRHIFQIETGNWRASGHLAQLDSKYYTIAYRRHELIPPTTIFFISRTFVECTVIHRINLQFNCEAPNNLKL